MAALEKCKRQYPGIAETVYYFIGEWGRIEMTYAEYLFNKKLRKIMYDDTRYRLACGRRIYSYSVNTINNSKDIRAAMEYLEIEIRTNPIQFFMPNGKVALEFLNNTDESLKMLVAGNRFGKTTHGIVDMILDLVPCDPEWLIFKENGVNFRPWNGETKSWGVASYMWRHVTMTINPLILQWMPDKFLGDYRLNMKGGPKKIVNAEKRPFIHLTNGSDIQYFCYQQDTANFESVALNGWLWDEQGMEDKFDGADERTRTKRGGRHIFPLTPHKIEGRSDTGAGTWIHKLWKGEQNKGHRIGRYKANTFDNPDWIYEEKNKVKAYNKWVTEPTKHHDLKTIEEGRSRLFGDFHESSGLVYDELVRDIHVIDPFEIPENWTKYRGVDHGLKAPTAVVFAAVTPINDIIIYDEYYNSGKTIYKNVENIIAQCGNKREFVGRRADVEENIEFDEYREVQCTNKFEWSVLDGRSFASGDPASNRKIGEMYEAAGLECRPAPGGDAKIDIVKEALCVDYERPHMITGRPGASKVYIFASCKMLLEEIFSYVWAEEKESSNGISAPKPRKKNDHAVNAMEYLVISKPIFEGDITQPDMDKFYTGLTIEEYERDDVQIKPRQPICKLTGY
jgi:hypothetical protein